MSKMVNILGNSGHAHFNIVLKDSPLILTAICLTLGESFLFFIQIYLILFPYKFVRDFYLFISLQICKGISDFNKRLNWAVRYAGG